MNPAIRPRLPEDSKMVRPEGRPGANRRNEYNRRRRPGAAAWTAGRAVHTILYMSSPTTQTQWQYLERDPKSSYKQLSIKGRRIKARTLYGQYVNAEEPRTTEQLAADFNLPLAAVEEAIAYCRSNPPEIEADFRREEA